MIRDLDRKNCTCKICSLEKLNGIEVQEIDFSFQNHLNYVNSWFDLVCKYIYRTKFDSNEIKNHDVMSDKLE